MLSCILATRLPTNTFHLEESEIIQLKATVLSVKHIVCSTVYFFSNTSRIACSNFASKSAAQSSNRGMVTYLTGATLLFALTRLEMICPSGHVTCTYTHAPNAFSLASQKPIRLAFEPLSIPRCLGIFNVFKTCISLTTCCHFS
uniref:Uncharacterized protein n=1 Tax=Cacopsylla melanoneura TaxID=428564 RepID=A0A8D9EUQ7_9HEMI